MSTYWGRKKAIENQKHEWKAPVQQPPRKSSSLSTLSKSWSKSRHSISEFSTKVTSALFGKKNRGASQRPEKKPLDKEQEAKLKSLRQKQEPFPQDSLEGFIDKNTDPSLIKRGVVSVAKSSQGFQLQKQLDSEQTLETASIDEQMEMSKEGIDLADGISDLTEKPLPTLNTPYSDFNEELMRKKMLAALIDGSSGLSASFRSKYFLGDLLGDGAFGFVFAVSRISDGKEMAAKFIIRAKMMMESWVRVNNELVPSEVACLMKLRHPCIISYVEHFCELDYVILITELHGTSWDASNPQLNYKSHPGLKFKFRPKIPGISNRTSCDLFECIDAHTKIPIDKAKYIFAQIVLALEYLQSQGLVHRDIKDENIVVDEYYRVKLIDFGSASAIPAQKTDFFKRYNGTPHFAAPEIVRGNAYQGPQAEIWTLGVLLYTIIFGENPFHDNAGIIAYNGRITCPRMIPSDLKDLIQGMLHLDVRKRMTLAKVKNHSWCSNDIQRVKEEFRASGYYCDD